MQCDAEVNAANEADPIPGCDGAVVGPPPLQGAVGNVGGVPGPVTTTDPTLVGAWTPLIDSDAHLAIHSIHRPTGKFLQFGDHASDAPGCDDEADCDKIVWYPPAPCSPFVVGHENCDVQFDAPEFGQHFEVPQPTELFCSAHVNLPPSSVAESIEPLILTVGGHLSGNNGIQAALTFSETLPDDMLPQVGDWTWAELDDTNLRRWYPSTTTLADGRALAIGGLISNELMCESDGNGFGVDCECDPEIVCDASDPPQDPPEDPPEPCIYNPLYEEVLCNPLCNVNGVAQCSAVTGYNPDVEILDRDGQGQLYWDRYEGVLPGEWLLYPFNFVLPDLPHFETRGWNLGGKLIKIGYETAGANDYGAWIYDDTGASPTVTPIGGESCTAGSSAVMLRPGKLMKFGGSIDPSRMTEVLDLSDPEDSDPQWRRVGPTGVARRYSTGLLLPDGTALATGGTMAGNQGDVDYGDDEPGAEPAEDERFRTVFSTELFDPESETWCRLADVPPPAAADPPLPPLRGYHSQSFLLPDGRVYLGASGRTGNQAVSHFNYQLFSPPYLFKGERPEVSFGMSSVVPTVATGTTLELERTGTADISRVTLVKLSSSTHNWDMEQRFVELTNVMVDNDSVTAQMPPSTCYATPGPYMVFAISDEGVPSIGQYLYVDGTCAAAAETSEPPVAEFVPMAVNMATNTLAASCTSTPTVLELQDFGRTVDELCQALGGCPVTGSVNLAARLVASDTQSVPTGGITLDTGVLTFTGGHGSFTESLRLDVKSGAWTSAVDLGSGNHHLELCATVAGVGACMAQPLAIGALSGTQSNAYGYRLGTIESRFQPIAGLPFTRRLMLTDNGTATVALPGGFRFPYFGTNYTTMYVGANGGIRFTAGTIAAANTTLPSTASSAPHIAPWWDDLNPAAGGQVLWRHMGKKIIVSWEKVPHKLGPASGRVSFQVHLWDDGRIEMHYDDATVGLASLDNGGSATIGMQRPGGTNSLVLSTNSPSWLASGARAAAYDRRGCIAADLRAIDSMPCEVVLDASAPLVIRACSSAPTAINIPVPKLATTCRLDDDVFVHGEVVGSGTRKPVIEGRATLPPGSYTLRWWVHGDHRGVDQERLFGPHAGPFEQSLTVQSSCATLIPTASGEDSDAPRGVAR